ncbi:MAG: DUF3024 domain-containing protein [Solirubrobacteraceae bacterium]
MPLPEHDVAAVRAFCARFVGPELGDEMRLEIEEDRGTVTIIERRAPWDPSAGPEWSRSPIARLRRNASRGDWALYRPDRSDGWRRYEGLEPVRDVTTALAEIERDPMGHFWG